MNTTNIQIGEKLKELRTTHGYTQVYIASCIDVKQPTYQQYEAGKHRPGATTLYKIANFYGLTTDEFLRLCIPIDSNIYYDALEETDRTLELAELTSYGKSERLSEFSGTEKKLLFYFSKLSAATQSELIDFAKFKYYQTQDNRNQ